MARDSSIELWACDEVHFQQHGSRCRMWVPPEIKDPVLLHAPTRKSVGYFGAVRLKDGKLVTHREAGKFDGNSFWQFMKKLKRRAARKGVKVVVISDNAKYHHALIHKQWREKHAHEFLLHFLPPYSPELNPIERVWKLLRRLRIHNQHFSELAALQVEVEAQLGLWSFPNNVLKKLCQINSKQRVGAKRAN